MVIGNTFFSSNLGDSYFIHYSKYLNDNQANCIISSQLQNPALTCIPSFFVVVTLDYVALGSFCNIASNQQIHLYDIAKCESSWIIMSDCSIGLCHAENLMFVDCYIYIELILLNGITIVCS